MNIKKLNEELFNALNEDVINEISYETKKSYLAKRQAQFDAMQDRLNKAKRLVRDTEAQKQGKTKLSDDQLESLVNYIGNQLKIFTGHNFYMKRYGNTNEWILEKGDYYNEWSNSFHFSFSTDDRYLNIFCGGTDSEGKKRSQDIKIALDEFTINKLNGKVIKELKTFIKSFNTTKEDKYVSKINKVVENIKRLLSKYKENIYGNWSDYTKQNMAKDYKRVIAIKGISIPHIKGYEHDYNIHAVCLSNNLDVIIKYTEGEQSYLHSEVLTACQSTPQDLYIACVKIEMYLKQANPQGRSNLKSQQQKLDQLKSQAEEAIKKYRNMMITSSSYDSVDNIQQTGTSYDFIIHYWGSWEGEDYDFQRPSKDTQNKLEHICDTLKKDYPSLKFSYGISEKHMINCYVRWS